MTIELSIPLCLQFFPSLLRSLDRLQREKWSSPLKERNSHFPFQVQVFICLHCQDSIILDLKLVFLFTEPKLTVSIKALPSSVTLFLVVVMLASFPPPHHIDKDAVLWLEKREDSHQATDFFMIIFKYWSHVFSGFSKGIICMASIINLFPQLSSAFAIICFDY